MYRSVRKKLSTAEYLQNYPSGIFHCAGSSRYRYSRKGRIFCQSQPTAFGFGSAGTFVFGILPGTGQKMDILIRKTFGSDGIIIPLGFIQRIIQTDIHLMFIGKSPGIRKRYIPGIFIRTSGGIIISSPAQESLVGFILRIVGESGMFCGQKPIRRIVRSRNPDLSA